MQSFAGCLLLVLLSASATAAPDSVTLYKIAGGECVQATLDKKYDSFAISFAGLKEGTCSSQGFAIADGTKTISLPVFGVIAVSKFKKSQSNIRNSVNNAASGMAPEVGDIAVSKFMKSQSNGMDSMNNVVSGTAPALGDIVVSKLMNSQPNVMDSVTNVASGVAPVLGEMVVSKFMTSQSNGVDSMNHAASGVAPVLGDMAVSKFMNSQPNAMDSMTKAASEMAPVLGEMVVSKFMRPESNAMDSVTNVAPGMMPFSQSFNIADGTRTVSARVLGEITAPKLKFKKSQVEVADSVTLHQIIGRECRQATIDKKQESIVLMSPGMKKGSCPRQGFATADGTDVISVPFFGDIAVAKFKKSPKQVMDGEIMWEQVIDDVTMYMIDDDECGEMRIDKKFESFAITHAGLKAGTCSSQGYTIPAGTKTASFAVLGETIGRFFKKEHHIIV